MDRSIAVVVSTGRLLHCYNIDVQLLELQGLQYARGAKEGAAHEWRPAALIDWVL